MLTKEQFFNNISNPAQRAATEAYFASNPDLLISILAAADKGSANISVFKLMSNKEDTFDTSAFATAIARDLKSRMTLKLKDKAFSISEKSLTVTFAEDFKTVNVKWDGKKVPKQTPKPKEA
jgi:hypothetical protein